MDVLTNVFHGSFELKELLQNVHRFAPRAHVAFIGWYGWRTAARQWTESSILDVPVVRVWEQPPSQSFYARNNANVHPNAKGHWMIANAVLKYLEWPDQWFREPHGPPLRAPHGEVCMQEHALLELTHGAEIVDLGAGGKGIAKEVVQAGEQGAITRINNVRRGEAQLTYLLRPRGDHKIMDISCDCECSPAWAARPVVRGRPAPGALPGARVDHRARAQAQGEPPPATRACRSIRVTRRRAFRKRSSKTARRRGAGKRSRMGNGAGGIGGGPVVNPLAGPAPMASFAVSVIISALFFVASRFVCVGTGTVR